MIDWKLCAWMCGIVMGGLALFFVANWILG